MTIAVTGYPGAGKSVAREVAEELGFKTVIMGDHVRRKTEEEWGERLRSAQSGESDESPSDVYGEFATQQRDTNGRGVVAEWCREEIVNSDGPVFVDGMRSPEEKEVFEEFTDLTLIFIHAPASLRLEWMRERARDGEDEFTAEDLIHRDNRENSWGVNELIQSSDYTVQNCTSMEDYRQNLRELFSELS